MNASERELLIEQAASAWRPTRLGGEIGAHPAWADLDEGGRLEAYDLAVETRRLEAALDEEGLSSTGWAVMRRIT